jgi:hypothetical protein
VGRMGLGCLPCVGCRAHGDDFSLPCVLLKTHGKGVFAVRFSIGRTANLFLTIL